MATNSILISANVIDQTENNNGISGLSNSCVSIGASYTANNTSSTSSLLVCLDEDATGTGSFGQATPTNQCTSCGVLQSNALTISLASAPSPSTICPGVNRTLTASVSFLPIGMQYQWGTGTVGSNIIAGQNTATLTIAPNVTTTYWVRLVEIANSNNASTSSASTTITVNTPAVSVGLSDNNMVWTGRATSNWNNINNWLIFNNDSLIQATQIPTISNDVIIPQPGETCVVNSPIIQGDTRFSKNLTILNNASLTMTGGVLRIAGDFTNNGTFTPGTNTVELFGANDQIISMNHNSNTFYNLTVNKTNREVHLGSNIQVSNNVNLTARNLNLNNFILNLGATGNLVGESESSRVYCNCSNGYIQSTASIGPGVTVQPGALGLTLTTNANQMGNTTIRRRHIQPGTNGVIGVGVSQSVGIQRVFDVLPEFNGNVYNNNLNVNITINFLSVEAQQLPNGGNIVVYRSTNQGATWDNLGFVSFNNNSFTINGLTGFSWVTAGPDDGNYLPIELLYFDAVAKSNEVDLLWATASETNNDYFTVERSQDGFNWEQVTIVAGNGNSIHRSDYMTKDSRPYAGLSYYRLKQTDFDGNMSYSPIVSVVLNSSIKQLLYVVNILGQHVEMNTPGMVILVFSNGETQKIINE